jgi:hypothetical protein
MARAAPSRVRRHRQVSRLTRRAAPTPTVTPAVIRTMWVFSSFGSVCTGRPIAERFGFGD